MSENSKIEWTDHTFNPWEGCQKVGPGCDHCYAETRNARFGGGQALNWGPGAPRRRTSPATWAMPRRWNVQADAFMAQHGRRQRVFCASLADWADNAVPIEWLVDLLELVRTTPHLDWLLLTKRVGIVRQRLQEAHNWVLDNWPPVDAQPLSQWLQDWTEDDTPPSNVWLGATITNQPEADRDIPKLLAVPARMRFLSMEPLLGPVNLERPRPGPDLDQGGGSKICQPWLIQSGIHWVIVGGESGPGARPMSIQWARELRNQCVNAGVPFLFKQWGEWAPAGSYPSEAPGKFAFGDYKHERERFVRTEHYPRAFTAFGARCILERVGKKAAGRQLDGRTWDETPAN